jgi:F-type H+-transporting ATPase subunit beta
MKQGGKIGTVVAVRGSVVDVHFEDGLPLIDTLLRTGSHREIAIEVLAQLNKHLVRGIALTPTQGLARGMRVEDTGNPLKAPVGRNILSRMFDVFGRPIDRQGEIAGIEWRPIDRTPPPLARRMIGSIDEAYANSANRVPLQNGGPRR